MNPDFGFLVFGSFPTCPNTKNLINVRKRLLNIDRRNKTCFNTPRIKTLSIEIRSYFKNVKISRVKQAATGGNTNLWKAVKIAKNVNIDAIPNNLTLGGLPVASCEAANSFAGYFSSKYKKM